MNYEYGDMPTPYSYKTPFIWITGTNNPAFRIVQIIYYIALIYLRRKVFYKLQSVPLIKFELYYGRPRPMKSAFN